MKSLHQELKKTYKLCGSHKIKPYAKGFYQKKITDDIGVKYFIDVRIYDSNGYDQFEFDSQFTKNDRTINIETISRTSDPKEEYRKYPTLKEIEDMFEKMRIAYEGEYYEKF